MRYPTSFDEIVGQHDAKEALRVEISRARRRNEPLPHLLLTGGPGLGKTLFAHVIATEMGVTFRKVSPGRLKPRDVYRAIFGPPHDLKDHDVLLLEEAHAAFAGGETAMAWLLDTLTDYELSGHPIPAITFVLATHRGIRSPALAQPPARNPPPALQPRPGPRSDQGGLKRAARPVPAAASRASQHRG